MVNYEPGQDRNVAALSILVMCDGFKIYGKVQRKIYAPCYKRSKESGDY